MEIPVPVVFNRAALHPRGLLVVVPLAWLWYGMSAIQPSRLSQISSVLISLYENWGSGITHTCAISVAVSKIGMVQDVPTRRAQQRWTEGSMALQMYLDKAGADGPSTLQRMWCLT